MLSSEHSSLIFIFKIQLFSCNSSYMHKVHCVLLVRFYLDGLWV